tara:strand:+ start:656 stop:994 length:339 start_codon:yes stop_codon:yes gene_type:complete
MAKLIKKSKPAATKADSKRKLDKRDAELKAKAKAASDKSSTKTEGKFVTNTYRSAKASKPLSKFNKAVANSPDTGKSAAHKADDRSRAKEAKEEWQKKENAKKTAAYYKSRK